jgi:trehalose 6-phosphate phosphatase
VIVEDKGLSVAVHYRQARQRSAARRAILTVARSLIDVRIIGGKLAVNFLLPDAPHKGLAVERERAHFACDTVIYVGDDETDEDVFQLDRPERLLAIRVGQKGTSAAPYYIRNQEEIDGLLETLVALRGDVNDEAPRASSNRIRRWATHLSPKRKREERKFGASGAVNTSARTDRDR